MIDAIANLPAPMRVKMTADILARIVQPVAALDLTPLTLLPSARIADGHNVTLTNDNSVVVLMLRIMEETGPFMACALIRLCLKAPNRVLRTDQGSSKAYIEWLAGHTANKRHMMEFMKADAVYATHATVQGRMEEESCQKRRRKLSS